MLKKKIIANSISNLTDARYFAGWMVDYFIFSIDPNSDNYLSPQEIGTFQSWVEGPKYYLEFTNEMEVNPEKYLVDLNCSGIYLPYSKRNLLANYDIPLIYSLNDNELDDFIKFNDNEEAVLISERPLNYYSLDVKNNSIFYNIKNQHADKENLLSNIFAGFMVHGSPEEKVGFKSYDELDDIFEILQDF